MVYFVVEGEFRLAKGIDEIHVVVLAAIPADRDDGGVFIATDIGSVIDARVDFADIAIAT